MPRRKNTPRIFANSFPDSTGKSQTRRILTNMRTETGDAEKDSELWQERIRLTCESRDKRKNGTKDWLRYYDWYAGEQWNDRDDQAGSLNSDNARDTATVNKTGSTINSIVPFLVNGEIRFREKPRREGDDKRAQIKQSLLNYEWRERKMTRPVKHCARDFVTIGHCVGKTGYTIEVDEAKRPKDDGAINYSEYVIRDAPFVERVNPLWFFFDLSAKDNSLRTARWCAEIFFVPLADVLANNAYDPKALAMIWSGDHTPTTRTAFETRMQGGKAWTGKPAIPLPEDHLIALVEIWDKKYKQRIIYADGVPRPLLAEEWPYDYLDGFPYVMANYIDCPNSPYGIGLPRWIEDQQLQLNRMRTLEQDIARKSRPRYAASEGTALEEVTKFQNGDEIIVGDIKAVQMADLTQGFQLKQANIQHDIEEMTGADALLQGQQLPSRTTASEVGARTRLTSLKLDQHVTDFEEFVEELAVQVDQHLAKHRIVEDVIEIVGPQGSEWVQYSSEDIQAEVDVTVEAFSAPKYDPLVERQQRKEIFQLAVSALPVMVERGQDKVFDLPQLFAWTLEPYEEADISRFFKPGPSYAQVQEPAGANAGAGLPPELAGQFAPSPVQQQPGVGSPQEGLSPEDLAMQLSGGMQ
jgi:hypothetical protein